MKANLNDRVAALVGDSPLNQAGQTGAGRFTQIASG